MIEYYVNDKTFEGEKFWLNAYTQVTGELAT